MRRFDKLNNIRNANILSEQRYLETKGLINENVITLQNILNNKGSLDHIKNNDQIRLKLIKGPFLDKNPDWKDKPLKFLFYDAREGMVGVDLIGHGKSANAYPSELVIDTELTNAGLNEAIPSEEVLNKLKDPLDTLASSGYPIENIAKKVGDGEYEVLGLPPFGLLKGYTIKYISQNVWGLYDKFVKDYQIASLIVQNKDGENYVTKYTIK